MACVPDKGSRVDVGCIMSHPPLERLRICWSDDSDESSGSSASKLARLGRVLARFEHHIATVPPSALTLEDVVRVHDAGYAEGVLEGPPPSHPMGVAMPSGARLLRELGACHAAAVAALQDGVAAAFTVGAHDAFWDSPGRSCPLNGWMVAAAKLIADGQVERIAIVDCSPQCGSGSQSIIDRLGLGARVKLVSFGRRFQFRRQAQLYLARARLLDSEIAAFRPDVVLYQAAAGSHVQSPIGGVLGTDQMRRRDGTVLGMARRLGLPIAWNIDGSTPPAPPIEIAVQVHQQTFREAWRAFAAEPLD